MEVSISRKNAYLRLFCWAWSIEDPETVDICKMFWGTILLPLALWCQAFNQIPIPGFKMEETFKNHLILIGICLAVLAGGAYAGIILLNMGLWVLGLLCGLFLIVGSFFMLIAFAQMDQYRRTFSKPVGVKQRIGHTLTNHVANGADAVLDAVTRPLDFLDHSEGFHGLWGTILAFIYGLKQKTCYLLKVTD